MDLRTIVTFIITDASVGTREGMDAVITAVRERQRINRANSTAIARATLSVGDKVSVHGISPKYLNGVEGKITSFNKTRSRATIEVTDAKGDSRVGTIQYGIPVQCFTVLNAVSGVHLEHDSSVLDFLEA